jgi:nicotinamidase-related amidase
MPGRQLGQFDREYILQNAKKAYVEEEADFDWGREKTALIIVDMLEEFVRPDWTPYWVPDATDMVPKLQKLIAVCRQNEVPIIYTAYEFHPSGADFPRGAKYIPIYRGDVEFVGQIFTGPSIYSEIEPRPEDMVILKPTYDAFYGTKMDLVLKTLGVENIIVCGTMTNFCCGATARAGFMSGYNVVFGSDINATDDPEMQESELKTLRRGFAKIMTCDQIMAQLECGC